MDPSKSARIRDLIMAGTILVSVLILFAAVAFRSGVFGRSGGFTQESDESVSDNDSIPPRQIEKYVAVYRAMQRNHSLTVEQACAQQGLTVPAFRDIERKIERNDQLRNRVRDELQRKNSPPNPSRAAP
jgi:hypothetical protein